jgi:hypothetical protein
MTEVARRAKVGIGTMSESLDDEGGRLRCSPIVGESCGSVY